MNKLNSKKNIVILKNLPSNLIEEAIIVVKSKNKIKNLENRNLKAENQNNGIIKGTMKEEEFNKIKNINKEERKFVIKEAEIVIENYIKQLENDIKNKKIEKIKKSNKKLKIINISLVIMTIVSIFLAFYLK